MGFLSRINDAWSVLFNKDDQQGIGEHLGIGMASNSGKVITDENAIQIVSVYASVRIISESIASVPLRLMQKKDNIRIVAEDNPLNTLVKEAPNDWMSSFDWRETIQGHVCLRGNGFSLVERNQAGIPQKIYPLHPDKVGIFKLDDGSIGYSYEKEPLLSEDVLHIKGIGGDGLVGYSPIRLMRDALGLTATADEFGGQLFANGAAPGGVLKVDSDLDETQYKRLREQWNERHGGVKRAGGTAILERGMSWQAVGLNSQDAQLLETRKFQKTEIASMFRVQPHLIGDLSKATFSNIEHQSIEFVTHTIRPWAVRWEQALNRVLLTERQRQQGFYFKFNLDALLRGDIKSRYQSYQSGIQAGWLTRNEARSFEDLNPIAGLEEPLAPLNMATPSEQNGENNDE